MDLISRQAAIDAINRLDIPEDMCVFEILSHIALAIGTLPSAQPQPQWIPVTADLPGDAEEVIVTWVNHDPAPYYAHVKDVPYTGFAVYYNGNWYWWTSVSKDLLYEYGDRIDLLDKVDDAIEITAWMPMPQPYRGEK